MNEFQNFREDNLTDSEEQERILTFINSMNVRNTAFLREREEEALAENIPIIRPQTQSLIRFFLDLVHPDSILEVGTATGFSSLFMLSYAPYAAITTIERDGDRIIRARQNFERGHAAGLPVDRIRLLEGDAAGILPTLQDSYRLVFMDAAKGQYIHFLPEVKRLLAPQGILLSDNIFKEGEILRSRFAVRRRDRTIHKRMREYLTALTEDPDFTTLLLQEGDGAAVSVLHAEPADTAGSRRVNEKT